MPWWVMLFYVDKANVDLPVTGNPHLIVTVAIGELYMKLWNRICRPSWENYAAQWKADIVVITEYLDDSELAKARSPAWQKLLVLDQPWAKHYPRLLWLDADILISNRALNIFEYATDPAKIGICVNGGRLSDAEKLIYLERLHGVQFRADMAEMAWTEEIYKHYLGEGLPQHELMYNTGVMLLSPRHHNELFRDVYKGKQYGKLYEQPLLSHEIVVRGLAQDLVPRFNWGIHESLVMYTWRWNCGDIDRLRAAVGFLVERELDNAYFLHFYGTMDVMKLYLVGEDDPVSASAAA
jgi:hypothetical protein